MARWVAQRVIVAAAFAVVALPWVAAAHAPPVHRQVVLQVDDQGVAALWRLGINGPQALLMARLHDRDGDGALRGNERLGVAVALVAKARGGVQLRWDDAPLACVGLEARLDATAAPELAGIGLCSATLPEAPGAAPHRLRVRLPAGQGPLSVAVQALGGWRVMSAAGATLASDARGLAVPLVLEPGGATEIVLVRTGSAAPAGKGE